jgi:serine/threonine protein kinase
MPAEWAADESPVEIGTLVRGRFELESILGEGGMGVVYRAVDRLHQEMEDRDPHVAIKILSAKFKRHPDALIALQRETRRAQLLAHENIVNVHTFDRDGSIVYMTMELLDGKSLRTIVAERPSGGLPTAEVVPMIRAMAKALAYAHDNDIVHSDFKPANVFLTGKKQIKVLDFGVARASPKTEPLDASATLDSRGLGGMTPAYASPQMLEGRAPTPSDDVFALAVVAHELLTGQHPFDYHPPDAARLRALKYAQFPGLSRSQRKALIRAFSEDEDSRHENAGAFLKEFEGSGNTRVLFGGAVAAAPVFAFVVAVSMGDRDLAPTVAFEDLTPEVQAEFDRAVDEGQTALTFGDAGINDALQYFSRAFELHPYNERAVHGLETVADRFLASIRGADTETQLEVFGALSCNDYLSGYSPVASACSEMLGAERCASITARCQARPAD